MNYSDSQIADSSSSDEFKGKFLKGGSYVIRRETHDSFIAACGAAHGLWLAPHPGLVMVATLAATGASIEEILGLAGSSVADGPMLGECGVIMHGDLLFDVEYLISREIVSVERKNSRRFGAMDLLRFVATVRDQSAVNVAAVTYTWVLPKRKTV